MLKTLLCTAIALMCSTLASAQLRYVDGSFRSTNASDMQVTANDLGRQNMTEGLADYAGTHDDSEKPSAIIRIGFKNMAAEDIEKHVAATVNPGYVNRTEYKRNPTTKAMECWVHVDPSANLTLTVTVDNIGSVRIPGLKTEGGHMYALDVESDETIPVKFTSNVDGTAIWFDGEALSGTASLNRAVTKEKARMGTHHVKAVAGTRTKEYDIDVSKANNAFMVDLLNRYRVQFNSNEAGVEMFENGKRLGTMPLSIEVNEGPHTYVVRKAGYDDKEYNINVSGNATHQFDIHKNKAIDFYALANNTDYRGASVYINNELRGQTPLQLSLPYGRYRVRMSANGRDKSDNLVVNDNTPSRFMLKLPAVHRRFNPFDIDFHKREFGLTFAYVQKWMHVSDGTQSGGFNYFGEEKHMNGFQIGVPVQPIFGYGLGMNTGLFFEGYFADYESTSMTELCLYMPVDFMFRLPLGEEFSLFVTGGIGIDWSIGTTLSEEGYDDYEIDYSEEGAPNHFNFSAEFGGGIQFKALQLSANYQIGLNNNSKMVSDDLTSKLRKLAIQLSIVF